MTQPSIALEQVNDGLRIAVSGEMVTQSLESVEKGFRAFHPDAKSIVFDLSGLRSLDTAAPG